MMPWGPDAAAQAFRALPENDHIANTVSRLASETGNRCEDVLFVERAEKLWIMILND